MSTSARRGNFFVALLLGICVTVPGFAADIYDAAVAHAGRSADDHKRDPTDRPADVLRLSGIKPGMQVADFLAADGYYSELLSYVVGDTGHVLLLNNVPYDKFVKDAWKQRIEKQHLTNVEHRTVDLAHMGLKDASLDAVVMVKVYHDLYWVDPGNWEKIDVPTVLDQLSRGRFDFGVGRGIVPYEMAFFDLHHLETEEIYRETLEIVLQGLTSEILEHRGPRYTYRKVPMILKPLQKPHPPLWYGLGHAAGAEWAATNRVNVITNLGAEGSAPLFARYREVWQRKHGEQPTPRLGMGRHVQYAALSLDEFKRQARLHIEALNHAVRNIPPEQMRMHLCWGNYEAPHQMDVPLGDIIDVVFLARPCAG